MLRNNRGQWALIEILVVVAILAVLAYFLLPGYLGSGKATGPTGTRVASPKERAQSVSCMNNLRQIRSAIDMYRQTNENGAPASFADLESNGVSGALTRCPDTGNLYTYDPKTGSVSCTTPGHGKY